MERPISVLGQRLTSFNPEATAFNPVFSSPVSQIAGSASVTSPSPSPLAGLSFPMAPMFNYSPFWATGGMLPLYRRDPLTPVPVRLEDFLSPDMQALVKTLEENPDVQEIQVPSASAQKITPVAQTVASPPTNPMSFKFPSRSTQPGFNAVDINELSAGLGLPNMKDDNNASPTVSQKTRSSQAHPGAIYGKLIGWALDKPLTAKDLAEYLQNNKDPRDSLVTPAPTSPTSVIMSSRKNMKNSPSGFDPVYRYEDAQSMPKANTPAPVEKINAKGPSAFQHQHRRSSNSSTSFRHHTRNPSNRRFPRHTSRAKRMDQGPMPSAADIYPDDANWIPAAPIYEGADYMAYQSSAYEQSQVAIENAFNWPTPAQVYKPESPPTAADVAAADDDVHTLMNELPTLSLSTLATSRISQEPSARTDGALSLDSRALSPAQLDGSRYGMRYHGLAIGDDWMLPKASDSSTGEPFRVRPRDHEGWGGWEWALRKGWSA